MDLDGHVRAARMHGDARDDTYRCLAQSFVAAHEQAPNGVSVEVGTRRGGSALMQLLLLEDLYPEAIRPLLITIDPYGGKPYFVGGDREAVRGLYGNDEYVAAKRLLYGYSNHLHFPVISLDWLAFAKAGMRVWSRGGMIVPAATGITHVLLDGDHDARTIIEEVQGFLPMLKPGGRIVIDNTPDDPKTIPWLEEVVSTWNYGLKLTLLRPLPDLAVLVRG
ncbi:MAG: class I SAM-dependent methyltransferase [Sphingomonas sp.]|jgi:hypothetical protein|uniref:class I SAM-dependent methyltransferase n=1 Tax=Sphingomonas sp. TaxID=28214 RepID=UPI0035681527